MSKSIALGILFLIGSVGALAAEPATPSKSISLFGDKPIQLSVDKSGIHQKKGGFVCSLNSSVSNKHYSEWGETEKDARIIVHKKCSNDSGLLICQKDNITCKEDK